MFCPHCGKESIGNPLFCSGCGTRLAGVQPAKSRRLSTAAGVLEIVDGSLGMLTAIVMLVIVAVQGASAGPVLLALAAAIIGGVAIICGSRALRRRNWGMALAGAVLILCPVTLLGMAALILTVLSKDEFEQGPSA